MKMIRTILATTCTRSTVVLRCTQNEEELSSGAIIEYLYTSRFRREPQKKIPRFAREYR
jgi:hypothetical protein